VREFTKLLDEEVEVDEPELVCEEDENPKEEDRDVTEEDEVEEVIEVVLLDEEFPPKAK